MPTTSPRSTWPADPSSSGARRATATSTPRSSRSGLLDQLLDAGYRYAFVSNADNLGPPSTRGWRAGSPPAVRRSPPRSCRRTPADRKGGHLAVRRRDGRLVLRETAQTAPEDAEALADISRHRYFNTNNLWLDLRRARRARSSETDGVLGLPLIRNEKTVDPSDPSSPR